MGDVPFDGDLFLKALVTMTVVMDPIGNIPVFLGLSRSLESRTRNRVAWQASVVAGAVILVFAFFGDLILVALGIGLPALKTAGGLLLLIVSLELLRPFDDEAGASAAEIGGIAWVPLGTPLLAGPGAIATIMVYTRQSNDTPQRLSVVLGVLAALLVIYLSLRFAGTLGRILKPNGVRVISRVMGFLLAAVAVELVAAGVEQWVHDGVA